MENSQTILIRGGRVVLPEQVATTNVLIRSGKIVAIDASDSSHCDVVIEAAGLTVLPGVIDDQVHFRDPGLVHKEDLRTGSEACAAGGVTTFLEMPNTKPSATTVDLLEAKYQIAAQKSRVNYGFYIGATSNNVEQINGASNIPGTKIFIGSSTGDLLVDDQDALERIFAETSLPICAHCEDETTVQSNREAIGTINHVSQHSKIRDQRAAVIATRRAIDLAIRHQHRFHVLHVSASDEIPLIAAARPYVTGEACLHHFVFSTDDYERLGSRIQMNPALKSPSDRDAMWDALLENKLQVIATDHAPHTLEEKANPYPDSPSGLPAVENSLLLMLDRHRRGLCSLEQIAGWMSDAPARVWGLVGKGRIAVGYDADLVLVDLAASHTVDDARQFTKSQWSPWNGTTFQARIERTMVGGETVFLDGSLCNGPNDSRSIPSTPTGAATTPTGAATGNRVRCDHARGGYWKTFDGIGI